MPTDHEVEQRIKQLRGDIDLCMVRDRRSIRRRLRRLKGRHGDVITSGLDKIAQRIRASRSETHRAPEGVHLDTNKKPHRHVTAVRGGGR